MVGRKLKSILDQLKLLILGTPTLDRDNALLRAKAGCDRLGWKWEEPVRIKCWFLHWAITTNADNRGSNKVFIIDGHSGEVIFTRMLPR